MTRPCTGRTNCASPAPQRIIFGIGRFFSTSPTISASAASSAAPLIMILARKKSPFGVSRRSSRSEEHTSELQSRLHLVCRLLLEKKNTQPRDYSPHQNTSRYGSHLLAE